MSAPAVADEPMSHRQLLEAWLGRWPIAVVP